MKIRSIKTQVLLLLLTITAVVVLSMALLMKFGVSEGFDQYKKSLANELNVRMVRSLANHYQQHESWQGFVDDQRLWHELIFKSATKTVRTKRSKEQNHKSTKNHEKGHDRSASKTRTRIHDPRIKQELAQVLPSFTLFDDQRNKVIGPGQWEDEKTVTHPIKVSQKVVGYLGHINHSELNKFQDKQFNKTIWVVLWMITAVMILVALLFTYPVARYFTQPIKRLNQATKKAAAGDYTVRTDIHRNDELGQLGQNFNLLTSTLQSNASIQQKMMADISHELRTPVAVLLAEIEAIQDGVHQADEKNLNLLHTQINHLKRLINDLHQLSITELGSMQYQMQAVDLNVVIEQVLQSVELAANQKSILIENKIQIESMIILGDNSRLQQLFSNVLNNAISYTHEGGQVVMAAQFKEDTNQYEITIEDTEPGLLDHELDQVFDRLYRQESSRNKKKGGSGLGLAIAKNIVEAHNGTITASSSSLGGVLITVRFDKHA